MKIAALYGTEKTVLSFEVFPPKKTGSPETIFRTVEALQGLKPDYISVTYGAGGSLPGAGTAEIASLIKNRYGIEAMAHLTCVAVNREEARTILATLKENGVENILALRGDRSPDYPPKEDFRYASDLVRFIRETGDFGITGACYPELHAESPDVKSDIEHLKFKVDCGLQSLITQLFFDNDLFYRFRERCDNAGITVPMCAGIMPVTSKKQIERMVTVCGASLPHKFVRMLQKYEQRPEALVDAGIAYATDQIVDLIANGTEGIHLYTMNNPYVATKIAGNISGLL